MKHELLIIFENEQVFSGALTYAREYASRTDARVTFLVLVAMSFSSFDFLGVKRKKLQEIETKAEKLLVQLTQVFIQKGLETSTALRIGDPAQELLKFLADRPSFQAIIWGSGQDLPFGGKVKKALALSSIRAFGMPSFNRNKTVKINMKIKVRSKIRIGKVQ